MHAVIPFVLDWGPIVALFTLAAYIRTIAGSIYWRAHERLDASHPDNLPLTAGRWLEEELARRGLDVHVLVSPSKEKGADAFLPRANAIILTQQTYMKKDPAYWATAAHELGHYLVHRRKPLGFVLIFARMFAVTVQGVAIAMLETNIFFASREVTEIAFALATAGVGLYVLVLVDEAAASIVGLRLLAEDARLDAVARRSARSSLAWAFFTYLASFAIQVLLLTERSLVMNKLERARPAAATLPTDGWILVAAFLTVFAVAAALRELHAVGRRPTPVDTPEEAAARSRPSYFLQFLRGAAGLTVVVVLWNQPLGPGLAIASGLVAFGSSIAVLVLLAPLLVAFVIVYVVGIVAVAIVGFVLSMFLALLGRRSKESPAPKLAAEAGPADAKDIERSAAALKAWELEAYHHPTWLDRAQRMLPVLVQLAGLAAIWWLFVTRASG